MSIVVVIARVIERIVAYHGVDARSIKAGSTARAARWSTRAGWSVIES